MGVSGCGKSTLLHILSTLLKPLGGEVLIMGDSVYSLSSQKLLEVRRKKIGIIFQSHYLFRGFTGEENLDVASILTGQEMDRALIKRFGLEQVIHQPVGELSGGQQQRLSILRVLTKKPKILFADEPTGNLDAETSTSVMEMLFEYVRTEGAGLVLVTHDKALATQCQRSYKIEENHLSSWS